jgi:hypothetical protein
MAITCTSFGIRDYRTYEPGFIYAFINIYSGQLGDDLPVYCSIQSSYLVDEISFHFLLTYPLKTFKTGKGQHFLRLIAIVHAFASALPDDLDQARNL